MREFNLYDNTLYYLNTNIYQNSLVSDRYPANFKWVSNRHDLESFYTYTEMTNIRDNPKRNLILLESSSIIPSHVHAASIDNFNKYFDKIYTHDSRLISAVPDKARWIPGGGIWIGTEWGGGEIKLYEKSKLCSFFNSGKNMCHMHEVRNEAFSFISHNRKYIDCCAAKTSFMKPIEYLKEHMFSIIFENNVDSMYFTEKILNCFATGTIPVYCGATDIGNFFNMNGIIQFTGIKDLIDKIETLSDTLYHDRYEAVVENLEKCKKFTCVEDFMWENYLCN